MDEFATLKISIEANMKDLSTRLSEVERSVTSTGEAAKKAGGGWKEMAAGMLSAEMVMRGLEKLKDVALDSIKEFDNEAVSLARLRASVGENVTALVKLAEAREKSTRYAHDETIAAEQTLAIHKLNADQIQQLIPVIQDFAAKSGESLESTAHAFAYAIEYGTARGLKPYGLQLDKTMSQQEVFNYLLKSGEGNVKGMSDAMGKLGSGPLIAVQNQIKAQEEELGKRLMPTMQIFAGFLSSTILPTLDWLVKKFSQVQAGYLGLGTMISELVHGKGMKAAVEAARGAVADFMGTEEKIPAGGEGAPTAMPNLLSTVPIKEQKEKGEDPRITQLKVNLDTYKKELELAADVAESSYKRQELSVDDYYKTMEAITNETIDVEKKELESELAIEKKKGDKNKTIEITGKLEQLEIERKQKLIRLTDDHAEALKKETKERADAERAISALTTDEEQGSLMSTGKKSPVAKLQEQRNKEMIKWDKDLATARLQIDKVSGDEKVKLQDKIRASEKSKDQAELAWKKRLADEEKMYKMELAQRTFGGMAQMMDQLYQLSGGKNVAFFRISQAMRAGETIMNTSQAIMKAMAEYPPGIDVGMASLAGAMGAVQLATIMAQKPPKAALGGLVGGLSHAAGGTLIEAEANEFIMNKNAVGYYGYATLNAMNQSTLPRTSAAATAGSASPSQPVTIVNSIDPGMLDRYMNSTAGQRAIVNVMKAKRFEVNKVLR